MIRVLIQHDSGSMGDTMTISQRRAMRATLSTITSALSLIASCAAFAADASLKDAGYAAPAYDWTGLYFGGHMGYAWGNSNWTASTLDPAETFASGSLNFTQPLDSFRESGSFFAGAQIGYNYKLPGSFVIGAEADASGPSFQTPEGISIGGSTNLASPLGPENYTETVLVSGTVRGRLGYTAGNWLIYGTGGLAWSYDQFTLTQLNSGLSEEKELLRWGFAAGAGIETPILPHWTGRLEYLYTGYNASGVTFPVSGQRFNSDLSLSEVRLGLNYKFDDNADGSAKDPKPPSLLNPDDVSFHGQTTFTWQGYPAIRSPYEGQNSLPGGGEAREVADLTLYAGFRLWQGAELWIDPEIDQGHGIGDTHGAARP